MGLSTIACSAPPPPYPPLPYCIQRNSDLIDPPDGIPKVGLIVKFRRTCLGGSTPGAYCNGNPDCGIGGICGRPCLGGPHPGTSCNVDTDCGTGGICGNGWEDETGQLWNRCFPFRLPDHDLFVIDAANPTGGPPQTVDHLGTTLFEVSVNPA